MAKEGENGLRMRAGFKVSGRRGKGNRGLRDDGLWHRKKSRTKRVLEKKKKQRRRMNVNKCKV